MTRDICLMFYEHGGYVSDSQYSDQDHYIAYSDATGTYIPQALLRMNSLCEITQSVSYVEGSVVTNNKMDDVILAELALSVADSEYDKLHVDPQTMMVENKHWEAAYRYMLDIYGISANGELVLPREAHSGESYRAYGDFGVATLSF